MAQKMFVAFGREFNIKYTHKYPNQKNVYVDKLLCGCSTVLN